MAENLEILLQRYPDYQQVVEAFIAADPGKNHRRFLEQVTAAHSGSKEGVLFICHSMGGGTKMYQDGLISEWQEKKRVYSMELLPDRRSLLLHICCQPEPQVFYFDIVQMDAASFHRLLEAFRVDSLYINQLITYPVPEMVQWITAAGVSYRVFAHDFYVVCPRFNLLDVNGYYCGAPKDCARCDACLQQGNSFWKDSKAWRSLFSRFLAGASQVIVPSQSTADIIRRYYPALDITVQPHAVRVPLQRTFDPSFAGADRLQVGVIGAIDGPKGIAVIEAMVRLIRERKLPVDIKVIGITNTQAKAYQSEDGVFEVTGPYDNHEISQLLAQYRIGVVFISSVCPETFSYTTSEAIGSGYPVMTFDLGAPAERVRHYGCGWVVNTLDAEGALQQLLELLENRDEIVEKAGRTLRR